MSEDKITATLDALLTKYVNGEEDATEVDDQPSDMVDPEAALTPALTSKAVRTKRTKKKGTEAKMKTIGKSKKTKREIGENENYPITDKEKNVEVVGTVEDSLENKEGLYAVKANASSDEEVVEEEGLEAVMEETKRDEKKLVEKSGKKKKVSGKSRRKMAENAVVEMEMENGPSFEQDDPDNDANENYSITDKEKNVEVVGTVEDAILDSLENKKGLYYVNANASSDEEVVEEKGLEAVIKERKRDEKKLAEKSGKKKKVSGKSRRKMAENAVVEMEMENGPTLASNDQNAKANEYEVEDVNEEITSFEEMTILRDEVTYNKNVNADEDEEEKGEEEEQQVAEEAADAGNGGAENEEAPESVPTADASEASPEGETGGGGGEVAVVAPEGEPGGEAGVEAGDGGGEAGGGGGEEAGGGGGEAGGGAEAAPAAEDAKGKGKGKGKGGKKGKGKADGEAEEGGKVEEAKGEEDDLNLAAPDLDADPNEGTSRMNVFPG